MTFLSRLGEYPSLTFLSLPSSLTHTNLTSVFGMAIFSKDILLASCLITLSPLFLTGSFCWIVYHYHIHVDKPQIPFVDGTFDLTDSSHAAFYLRFDSTVLMTFASSMSTVAPLLTAYSISLVAYPIAQALLKDNGHNDHMKITTPYQLLLLIKFLRESTYAALWSLWQYCFGWKKRARCTPILRLTAASVGVPTILSLLLVAIDTWLHVATRTVSVSTVSNITGTKPLYSLSLLKDCLQTNNSHSALKHANLTCNVGFHKGNIHLSKPSLNYETLNNISKELSVTQYMYVNSTSYLSISPSAVNQSHDFTATTIGLQMSCQPISDVCKLNLTGPDAFNCSDAAFAESLTDFNGDALMMKSFQHADLSDIRSDPYKARGVNNPFYWVAAFQVPSAAYGPNSTSDRGFIFDRGTVAVVLHCTVSIINVEYDSVRNQITRFVASKANDSIANIFNLVPSSQLLGEFGWTNVQVAMEMAGSLTNDPDEYIKRFTKALSNVLLSSGTAAVEPTQAVLAQQRVDELVTKLPKSPFYALLVTNFALILLGVILTVLAVCTTEEAQGLQTRLSLTGVITAFLETERFRRPVANACEMFNEYFGKGTDIRVRIDHTIHNGFEFQRFEELRDNNPHRQSDAKGQDAVTAAKGQTSRAL